MPQKVKVLNLTDRCSFASRKTISRVFVFKLAINHLAIAQSTGSKHDEIIPQ